MAERWINIIDNYYVSDEGNFKRIYKNGKTRKLITYTDKRKDGILCIKIHQKEHNARRLVWEAFRGSILNDYVVVSKYGYKTICDLYSLECVPRKVSSSRGAKLRGKKIIDLDTKKIYRSTREAVKDLHISRQTICDYCNQRTKKPMLNLRWYSEE